jgi:alkylhydroperoxidase family enzyme
MLGKRAGLSEDEALDARRAESKDRKTAAALRLAVEIVETKGFVSDQVLANARSAGLSDGEIAEVIAAVALNIYTNYFNHVAGTAIDFPAVPALTSR